MTLNASSRVQKKFMYFTTYPKAFNNYKDLENNCKKLTLNKSKNQPKLQALTLPQTQSAKTQSNQSSPIHYPPYASKAANMKDINFMGYALMLTQNKSKGITHY